MTDALVNQECLVVLHSGGLVRLYSLQHIITQVTAFSSVGYFGQFSNCSIYLCQKRLCVYFALSVGTITVEDMNKLFLGYVF